MNAAIFLDRDGVLIRDDGLLTRKEDIHLLPGIATALEKLRAAGFKLIVVSNQAVVARGLLTEQEVAELNVVIGERIRAAGGPPLDGSYFCPHHPNATRPEYRIDCECRKPKPGMLLQAAREHGVELSASFLVGDRITDIIAGARAGCRTILVESGAHLAAPIETREPLETNVKPHHVCADLATTTDWILHQA